MSVVGYYETIMRLARNITRLSARNIARIARSILGILPDLLGSTGIYENSTRSMLGTTSHMVD